MKVGKWTIALLIGVLCLQGCISLPPGQERFINEEDDSTFTSVQKTIGNGVFVFMEVVEVPIFVFGCVLTVFLGNPVRHPDAVH